MKTGDRVTLKYHPDQSGAIINGGIVSAETGEPLVLVKLDAGDQMWFSEFELQIDKSGWDCRKCGWVHHPDNPCACPPDSGCDCCVIENVTVGSEAAK